MTTTVVKNELYNALNANIDFNPKFKDNVELTPTEEADNSMCFALAITELAGKMWRANKTDVKNREVTMVKENWSVTFNFRNYTYRIEDANAIVKGVDLN